MTPKRQFSIQFALICMAIVSCRPEFAQSAAVVQGPGCTTATMIDWDCDGYGPGSPLGPDADDNDPTVNTSATALAKYGDTAALLAHLGYHPLRRLYISTAGNDSAGQPNNEARPYLSWKHVAGKIRPGDAVIWRAGTYTMSQTMNITGGTAANPSFYMAYPGERVTLDWSAANTDGLRADGQSYWTTDGLIFKGGKVGAGIAEQQYSAVTNMTVRNMETTGWYNGVFFMNNMTNILIERSVFHDLYINGEHNLYIGASRNTNPNFIFRNNIVYKAGMGGGHNLHINGRFPNATISGNIMYQALNSCLGLQMGVNHSLIQNNICFTTSGHAPVFLYDYGQQTDPNIAPYDENYNTFRNNTFYYDGADYGVRSVACNQYTFWVRDDSTASHDLGHNTYDNNIFYTGCTDGSGAAIRYDTDVNGKGGLGYLATDTWRNNIFYTAGTYTSAFMLVGNYKQDAWTKVSFNQFQAGNLGGTTNLQSDPKVIAANPDWYNAPQRFNLQVQAGSPAIGAGLAADAPATDIRGKTRGSKPDIGAYDMGAAPLQPR